MRLHTRMVSLFATSYQLSFLLLRIEVRIEDAHLRYTVHRKLTAPCGLPDRFRRGRVIDAKGLLLVLADIGMDPGHLILLIVAHDCSTDLCAGLIHGKDQSLWKGSFDDIAWHILLLSLTGGERFTSTLSKERILALATFHIAGISYIR